MNAPGSNDAHLLDRPRLVQAVGRLPVTVVVGPFAAGKSVLLRQVAATTRGTVIDAAIEAVPNPEAGLLLVDNAECLPTEQWQGLAAQQLAADRRIVFAARRAPDLLLNDWRRHGILSEITFARLCLTAADFSGSAWPRSDALERILTLTAGWPGAMACALPVQEAEGDVRSALSDWLAAHITTLEPALLAIIRALACFDGLQPGSLAPAAGLPADIDAPDLLRRCGVPLVTAAGRQALPPFMREALRATASDWPPDTLRRCGRAILQLSLREPAAVGRWPLPAHPAVAAPAQWFHGLRTTGITVPLPPETVAQPIDRNILVGAHAFAAYHRADFAVAAEGFAHAADGLSDAPELQTAAEWSGIRSALAAGQLSIDDAVARLESTVVRADQLGLAQIVTAAAAAAAGLLIARGRLAQAEAMLELAARYEPNAAWLTALRCSLLYLANRLAELRELLAATDSPTDYDDAAVTIEVHRALLAAADGDETTALTCLARLQVATLSAPLLMRESLAAYEVELHLRFGRLAQPQAWLHARPHLLLPAANPAIEKLQLTALRVTLTAGRFDDAEHLLTLLRRSTEQLGIPHRRITLLLLEARLRRGRGRPYEPQVAAARRLAAECGMPRLVLDDWPGPAAAAVPAITPVELSVRDRQLLQLIAGGCSNREIARQLMLSEGTVKQYLVSLFARLGVRNRTAAAAAARHLQLFDEMT